MENDTAQFKVVIAFVKQNSNDGLFTQPITSTEPSQYRVNFMLEKYHVFFIVKLRSKG